MQKLFLFVVLAQLAITAQAADPHEPDPDPILGTYLPGIGDHDHAGCQMLPEDQARSLHATHDKIDARPMPRPVSEGASLMSSQHDDSDPVAGLVPQDFVAPVVHVREVGHLFHEMKVEIEPREGHERLIQALAFEAPKWARMMLVEFEPDETIDDPAPPGLFLSPDRPFVEGEFELREGFNWDLSLLQRHVFAQSAYRSENRFEGSIPQYVLVTRDMDPAPAGRKWHVAIGQMEDDGPVAGTLKVWFSGSSYRAPLAFEFYYDAEEKENEVGYFDPTPREPNGDNPAATMGEAMRWAVFRAAEDLLEELDFDGMFPIRVLLTTHDDNSRPAGSASSNAGSFVDPKHLTPGRVRARPAASPAKEGSEVLGFHVFPLPAWEREVGTDACRVATGRGPRGRCRTEALFDRPGEVGSTNGFVRLLRDFELDDGTMWRWDKNFNDQTGRPNIINLIKHELMHVIGFIAPEKSQAYLTTFEPPRPLADAPVLANSHEEHFGTWSRTVTRKHHYGPIASPSARNPWRDTSEPGPRLQDDGGGAIYHLMPQDGDELAEWGEGEENSYMRARGRAATAEGVGIAREILADVGYARGTYAVQDRRLPRQWFDPAHSGHGIDFRRIERDDGSMVHFLHFYTYDADGNPEWYIAVGEVDDRMIFEAELDYVTYAADRSPPQQVDPARSGTVRIDLDPAIDDAVCADRRVLDESGVEGWLVATFEFDLPDGSGNWCLEPVKFGRLPAFPEEGSGSWFASDPDDGGWGMSVLTRNWGPRPIINAVTYYYDSQGEPTWAWGVAGGDYTLPYGSLGEGVTIDMLHFHGFCRTCEPVGPESEPAGVLHLKINQQATDATAGNQVLLLDLNDRSPVGGQWLRENVGIKLLSSPHPDMLH